MKITKTALLVLASIGLAPFLTGCASMMCGSQQDVSIDSRPRGADVLVYDSNCQVIYKSTTPCVTTLKRRSGNSKTGTYVVVVNKEGFNSTQVPLIGHVNSAYYLNLFTAGIGFIVDPITGAMWGLSAESPDGHEVKDNAGFFDNNGIFVNLQEIPDSAFVGPQKPAPAPAKPVADAHNIQASVK